MGLSEALTARSLIVEAQSILRSGGYEISSNPTVIESLGDLCFVGEDAFGVLLVVAYDGWSVLYERWKEAQSALVKLLTEKLGRGNPKAWEGYLVLLTPSFSDDERAEDEVRYDTSRVRKIVGTGETITYIDDLNSVLVPLLPLSTAQVETEENSGSVLDRLPDMLVERAITREIARAVVQAFKADQPLMEAISGAMRK